MNTSFAIGYTQSAKPVFFGREASHVCYGSFTKADRSDATDILAVYAQKNPDVKKIARIRMNAHFNLSK